MLRARSSLHLSLRAPQLKALLVVSLLALPLLCAGCHKPTPTPAAVPPLAPPPAGATAAQPTEKSATTVVLPAGRNETPSAAQAAAAVLVARAPAAPAKPPAKPAPAPAVANPTGPVEVVDATPEVPAHIVIKNALRRANEAGQDLLVYVGASWCDPCVRFKKAVKAGVFNKGLPGVRFLAFDADADGERLKKIGYRWTYVPLFVRPAKSGWSSGVQIAGVPNKAGGAADLLPRLQKLLKRAK